MVPVSCYSYDLNTIREACRLLTGQGRLDIPTVRERVEDPRVKAGVVAIAGEGGGADILDREDLRFIYNALLDGESGHSCGSARETESCKEVLGATINTPVQFRIEGLKAAIELYHDPKYSTRSHIKLDEIKGPYAGEIKRLAEVRSKVGGKLGVATTPGVLDLADFYLLLSKLDSGEATCVDGSDEACRRMLRRAIYLPEVDPEGVKLTVVTRPNGDGSNVAMVKITPTGDDRETPPDVFIGGIFQPAVTYLPGAIEFARAEKNEIIIVDAPGVGGSRLPIGTYLTYENIVRGFDEILAEAGGNIRYLMGHSMGTIIVRDQYHERRLKGIGGVEKYILIAPTPTAEEVQAGLRPDPYFSDDVFQQIFFDGIAVTSHDDIEAFMRRHTKEEREKFERIAMREDVQFGRAPTFLRTFARVAENTLLNYADRDGYEDLLFAVGEADELQVLENPGAWEGRRGIFVMKEGDHAYPAGEETGPRFFTELREFLNTRPDRDLPSIDLDAAADWWRGRVGPAFQIAYQHRPDSIGNIVKVGGGLGIDYQRGLNERTGYSLGAQALLMDRYVSGYDSHEFSLPVTASAGLLVAPFLPRTARWNVMPLQVSAGIDPANLTLLPFTAGTMFGYDIGGTGFHEVLCGEASVDPETGDILPFTVCGGVWWLMGGVGELGVLGGVQLDPYGDLPTTPMVRFNMRKGVRYFSSK